MESIEGGCRAHRSPVAKPNLAQRPWPVIIRLYRYQIKDLLIREARRGGKLQYHYQQREGMALLSRWREGLCGQPIHCICIILSIYVMLLTTSVTLSFAAVCRRLDDTWLLWLREDCSAVVLSICSCQHSAYLYTYMHVLVPLLFYFFLSHFSTFCVSGKMFCSDVVEGTAISDQKLKGLIMNLFYRIFVFSFWIR